MQLSTCDIVVACSMLHPRLTVECHKTFFPPIQQKTKPVVNTIFQQTVTAAEYLMLSNGCKIKQKYIDGGRKNFLWAVTLFKIIYFEKLLSASSNMGTLFL